MNLHTATNREEDETEPPRPPRTWRSDLKDMLKWALRAAAITLVFGIVLNVFEALL